VAQPIPLELPKRDPRIALQARLQDAPAQHAEALLAAYGVLQGLHDSGALDLIGAALGSRDQLLDIAVGASNSPASLRAIRNLLLLTNMLGAIDPEVLKILTRAAPQILQQMIRQPERPGVWTLLKDFLWNQDFRHGMAAVNTVIEVFGRSLAGASHADADSAPAQ
jgi:uncharacterized protein YjgD (DUF1641 family)